ncbi:PadR family transcriptional regulator [Natronobeatus ordinarius]|uniref:PadR family transcriptional regulator n=1 Tax=Natronobeatus ordinarius TaxID=2963433 RepID=UPI0020CFB7E7|nr:PadR family transcriptional regulator [Natronobeatus ordinarius]
MYDDDSRGLESPDRPDASTVTDQRLVTDGGTAWGDLTAFQRDVLEAIGRLERADETTYGMAIGRALETKHGEVNHGRLYPNLDDLVQAEFIEKTTLDRRTNRYTLTDEARAMLEERAPELADVCGLSIAVADGGSR